MGKEIEIAIPDSLNEIKLGRYLKFSKFSGDEALTKIKMIETFCGVPDVLRLPKTEVEYISTKLKKVLSQSPELTRTFNLNGKLYGFIPNLKKMSFGEFVDLETFCSDSESIHRVMSILYRPVTSAPDKMGFYQIAEYTGEEDPDQFLDMPLSVAFGAYLFFYRIAKELLKNSLELSEKSMKTPSNPQTSQHGESSIKNGDGMPLFLVSLLTMYEKSSPSLLYPRSLVLGT